MKKEFKHTSWFNEEFLNKNNFKLISEEKGQYGKAVSIKPNGYRTLGWNREGSNLTYEGNKLEPNLFIEIKLDGGTRTGFHGIIYNGEQFKEILSLVR